MYDYTPSPRSGPYFSHQPYDTSSESNQLDCSGLQFSNGPWSFARLPLCVSSADIWLCWGWQGAYSTHGWEPLVYHAFGHRETHPQRAWGGFNHARRELTTGTIIQFYSKDLFHELTLWGSLIISSRFSLTLDGRIDNKVYFLWWWVHPTIFNTFFVPCKNLFNDKK